jgi:TRAP-type uncharacterized transport system substrate-binding protein
MFIKLFTSFVFTLSLVFASDLGKIATGNINGTYIELGKDISRLMFEYNIKIDPIDTLGSSENLDLLTNDITKGEDIYWAIVQKDALKYYQYKNPEKEINKKIKAVLPIYNEGIHIFVKEGSSFKVDASRNFKVAVSSKHSGSYITAKYLESALGAKFDYLFIDFNRAKKFLIANEIDMYIEVIALKNQKFLNITGLDLLELHDEMPNNDIYAKKMIDSNTYSWLKKDTSIYTIPSVIITNVIEEENDKTIEAFIKIILANYKNLQTTGNKKWKEIDFRNFSSIDESYHHKAKEVYKSLNLTK